MSFRLPNDGTSKYINFMMNVDDINLNETYNFEFTNTTGSSSVLVKDESLYSDKFLRFNFESGVNFLISRSGETYNSVDMSGDGSVQTISIRGGFMLESRDFGSTWSDIAYNELWVDNTMDFSGVTQYAVVTDGGIWKKIGVGTHWTEIYTDYKPWLKIEMSRKQLGLLPGPGEPIEPDSLVYVLASTYEEFIYKSNNGGSTWTQILTEQNWRGLAVSYTGKYMMAGAYDDYLYISSDYGENWTTTGQIAQWFSCSVSSTGQYMLAGQWDGTFLVSNDFGATWTDLGIVDRWSDSDMSDDGATMYITGFGASNNGSLLYYSNDYGVTWNTYDVIDTWNNVACSSDGEIVTATSYELATTSNIYIGLNNMLDLEDGWYTYKLTNTNKLIKEGQTYIYNSDEPGNIPQVTNTYEEDKDKYVYNR
jgi:hypothetical protein